MDKHRSRGEVSGSAVVGNVRNRTVLILDCLIAGGGAMQRAALVDITVGIADTIAALHEGREVTDLES